MLVVVAVSAFARAIVIWIFRPEFAGWFNHTYYYFVQVRGILEQGSMPYSDLPLLFYLYMAAARGLMFIGFTTEAAIVNSTRLVMSVVPALTAVPVYCLLRAMRGGEEIAGGDKLLVVAAAFLPLNFVHMPELLQKNSFGILLFACLLAAVFKALHEFSIARGVSIAIIFALIGASHFGTLAVAILFLVSVALALLATEGFTRRSATVMAGGVASVIIASLLLLLLVPERLGRIVEYGTASVGNSLLGREILEGSPIDKFLYGAAIITPLALLFFAVRHFRGRLDGTAPGAAAFLLANLFLAYLLAAPFVDTAVIPRFLLFLPMPALVILAGLLRTAGSRFLRTGPALVLVLVCMAMMTGEVMGVVMRNSAHRAAHAELVRLRESGIVSSDDLIVTSYGVNPICNWFLRTKSSLITAFETDDLEDHRRVFVLVTETAALDDLPVDRDGDGRLSDVEKYYAARRPLEVPSGARSVFKGESFEMFELTAVPDNWKFDGEGRWIGYGRQ